MFGGLGVPEHMFLISDHFAALFGILTQALFTLREPCCTCWWFGGDQIVEQPGTWKVWEPKATLLF